MSEHNWKRWDKSSDLNAVPGLREAIHRAQISPLLNPSEARDLRTMVLETFGEVLESYLEENELRWRCDLVARTFPSLPMQAVFRAVEIEIGVSKSLLEKIWYGNRRKAHLQEVLHRKLKEKPQPLEENHA